jgi:hypothetical protein
LAPALSAGTASGRLDAATLDVASAVIIGGPDALTEADVSLLDQYVRVRGGTVILLPERVPAGPSAQLFGSAWSEHLLAAPELVGTLQASEILRLDRPPAISTVLARSGSAGAIVSMPSGSGRIIVSGAMDAWRYRQVAPSTSLRASTFDAFWRSLIADAAAQGAALQLRFDHDLAAVGSRVDFAIRDQRMTPSSSSDANATVTCGEEPAWPVRLWPGGAIGEFTGDISLPSAGGCTVNATVGDRHVGAVVAVMKQPRHGVEQTLAKLERAVKDSGGATAGTGDESSIARTLQQGAMAPAVMTAVHPMRAAWWIVPFAGCLSIEWWLRRRNGLR